MQAHYTNPDPELVEGGQLLALFVPSKGHGDDNEHKSGKKHDGKEKHGD